MNNFFCALILSLSLLLSLTLFTPHYSQAGQGTGQSLYLKHCGQCHGNEGQGFKKLYPPLLQSAQLIDHPQKLPCTIRFGIQGTIEISPNTFNQSMPGNPTLNTSQIAAIINYTRPTLAGVKGDETPLDQIERWLRDCTP